MLDSFAAKYVYFKIPPLVHLHLLAHYHPSCDQCMAAVKMGLQSNACSQEKDTKQEALSSEVRILSHSTRHNCHKIKERAVRFNP